MDGKNNPTEALNAAIKYISYRPRSEKEIADKLIAKGFDRQTADAAIDRLKETGYINDANYAKALAGSRMRNKSWGPLKISADLKRRGLADSIIKESIGLIRPLEESTARNALDKWMRLKGVTAPIDRDAMPKAYRFLKSRGFSDATVGRVIRNAGSAPPEE